MGFAYWKYFFKTRPEHIPNTSTILWNHVPNTSKTHPKQNQTNVCRILCIVMAWRWPWTGCWFIFEYFAIGVGIFSEIDLIYFVSNWFGMCVWTCFRSVSEISLQSVHISSPKLYYFICLWYFVRYQCVPVYSNLFLTAAHARSINIATLRHNI